MLTDTQISHPFALINFLSDRVKEQPLLVMQTQGAQYIFQVHRFRDELSMQLALDRLDPADRRNAVHVPGQWAFLMTAGNMQHIPMERLDPHDVYTDIQESKQDAAKWVSERWNMIFSPQY